MYYPIIFHYKIQIHLSSQPYLYTLIKASFYNPKTFIIIYNQHLRKDLGEEGMSEEYNDEEEPMDVQYQDEDYGDYDLDLTYKRTLSEEKPYAIYSIEEIIKTLKKQITTKEELSCLPYGWTLMLYLFTDFSSDYFDSVIDQEQTGRKMIKFVQNYQVQATVGQCSVCLDETNLYNNVCGHKFCFNCWKYHMQIHHNDRNRYELFPMCQQENCYHRTNYYLMQFLWNQLPELQYNFNKLLCLKYSQTSLKVKVCPKETCSKVIYINYSGANEPIICHCKTQICKNCGQRNHVPLDCFDLSYWNDLKNKRQNQWLNAMIIQRCPMCKTIIEKNEGCIHMTCLCKYEFCWICMKVWKGHTNFQKCAETSKEDHEKKLNLENEKKKKDKNFYNERFEQTTCFVERIERLMKKNAHFKEQRGQLLKKKLLHLKIMENDSKLFNDLVDFTKQAWQFEQHCTIYIFFEKQNNGALKSLIKLISKVADEVDDFVDQFDKMIREMDQQHLQKESFQALGQMHREQFFKSKQRYCKLLKEASYVLNELKRGEIGNASLFKYIEKADYLPKVEAQKSVIGNQPSQKSQTKKALQEHEQVQRLRLMEAEWNAQ